MENVKLLLNVLRHDIDLATVAKVTPQGENFEMLNEQQEIILTYAHLSLSGSIYEV